MKKITKKQFLADVKHEIDMLKLHATKEELSYLNFKTFIPESPNDCIYGQITGTCESNRAKYLMEKCCIRMWDFSDVEFGIKGRLMENASYINGAFDSSLLWRYGSRDTYDYLSALEGYIQTSDAKNAEIIAYLRDEREDLVL